MSDEVYSVILKGYQAGKGEYYVEEDFAKLFKITPEKANQYKKAIDKTVASCEVENTKFNTSELSLE